MYLELFFTLSNLFISAVNWLTIFNQKYGSSSLLGQINELATVDLLDVETKWFEQPLDHFNETDNRTWKMKYLQRIDMWKTDGPIYLHIGGQQEISYKWATIGTTYDLAKETNGAMFLSEHRYYGLSKPFDHFTTENLVYLSSRQAIADLAYFLTDLKSKPEFTKSKVVVIGGFYAGNLAAWLKLLYPNLVDAALASSGPVLAKVDFDVYLEAVSDNFKQYGTPGCYELIEDIFNDYDNKLKTKEGIDKLKEEHNICDETDMTKLANQQLFFWTYASYFMGAGIYGDVNYIKKLCERLNPSGRVFPQHGVEMITWNKEQNCFDYEFDKMIREVKYINWYMAFVYQKCTEFGQFIATTSDKQPFTKNIPIEFHIKMCTDLFGKEFDRKKMEDGVKKTNEIYGGLKPNVSKVVFVNGELDPWRRLSILKDISNEAPAKVIPISTQCNDLLPAKESDSKELEEARKYIKDLIKKWIGASEFPKNNEV